MPDLSDPLFIRSLGDGLILRRSSPADAEKLFHFNALIHGEFAPDERIGQWARDLLEQPHPTFGVNDFTIVEQLSTGRIVSSLNLISQTWLYEGIPFGVGRPELVGTLSEFRKRGLVRIQFEEIHRWSAKRAELVQAITGIPNYYRQFGYEMCVDLEGSRSGYEPNLPKLADGTPEPYRLRLASETDIPFLSTVYAHAAKRSLLYAVRDEALWRLELSGRSQTSITRLVWHIIERVSDGEAVGFLAHPWFSGDHSLPAILIELKAGISWLDVSPTLARKMWELGKIACQLEGKLCTEFTFSLSGSHPIYQVMNSSLPHIRRPYAWYLRVPDLPALIARIAPVLEERLAESLIPGYNNEIKINFYTSGLHLGFTNGRITKLESWQPDSKNEGDIAFPNQTFLQLVFGYRKLDELIYSYADCWSSRDETTLLINSLFPHKASQFLGIV